MMWLSSHATTIGWIGLIIGVIGLAIGQIVVARDVRALRRRTTDVIEVARSSDEKFRHCDDYISDPSAPTDLRWFIFVNRLPAPERLLYNEHVKSDPVLYAKHDGNRVRVVMASRLGDLGITSDLSSTDRYQTRVAVEDLTDFTATP